MERQLILAGTFLGVGALIWLAFLRPVPVSTARGVIRTKTFTSASEHIQYPAGDRQGFRSPTTIQRPEHFVLGIQVEGESEDWRYAVNTAAAAAFEIGQLVDIEYQTRGFPPIWRRVFVLDAKPVD